MAPVHWVQECESLKKEAERLSAEKKFKEAAECYDRLSNAWLRGASQASSADQRKARMENSIRYRETALRTSRGQSGPPPSPGGEKAPVRERAGGGGVPPPAPREGAEAEPSSVGRIRGILEQDDVGRMIISLVDSFAQESTFTWDDIGGLDDLVQDLKQVLGYSIARQPEGVRREASGDILLYGPPGTGKTILASALSNSITMGSGPRGKFFNVRVAGLKGHYQGNTEKSISLLYETARDLAPSLVFIDEIDGLCTSRGGGQDSAARAILGVLLQEMDGMASKGKGPDIPFVLTVGATNTPWDLDHAILSRFGENRVYVPPPDAAGRRQILEKLTVRQGYAVADGSLLGWLSDDARTAGYSGRDIRSLSAIAKRRMELGENPWLSAWNSLSEISDRTLTHRPLTREDFQGALVAVPASISEKVVRHYEAWRDDPAYRPPAGW